MSQLRWIHPLILATSVLGAGALQAQEGGTVTGVVVDAATGAPLPGVRAGIGPGRVGATRRVGVTDAQGRFALCRLQPGPAELAARLHGYRGPTLELTVYAGEAPPVRLALAADTSGQPARAGRPGHEPQVGTFGIMLDGKRFIGSSDGCGGTPEVPYFEMADLDPVSIQEVVAYKGAEAAERFRAPVEGLLVVTTEPAPAP